MPPFAFYIVAVMSGVLLIGAAFHRQELASRLLLVMTGLAFIILGGSAMGVDADDKAERGQKDATISALVEYARDHGHDEIMLEADKTPIFYREGKKRAADHTVVDEMQVFSFVQDEATVPRFKDVETRTLIVAGEELNEPCVSQEVDGEDVSICTGPSQSLLIKV